MSLRNVVRFPDFYEVERVIFGFFTLFTKIIIVINWRFVSDSYDRIHSTTVTNDVFVSDLALVLFFFFNSWLSHNSTYFRNQVLDFFSNNGSHLRILLVTRKILFHLLVKRMLRLIALRKIVLLSILLLLLLFLRKFLGNVFDWFNRDFKFLTSFCKAIKVHVIHNL